MSRQIDLAGASGARYRYTAMEENRFLPPAGANRCRLDGMPGSVVSMRYDTALDVAQCRRAVPYVHGEHGLR